MAKLLRETEAIVIYPVPEPSANAGFYWRVRPPKSLRAQYKLDGEEMMWAESAGALLDALLDMSRRKRDRSESA
jgi:hypothetical protein